jgi:hypothetical protein
LTDIRAVARIAPLYPQETLYEEMPVRKGWHDDYTKGPVDTSEYFHAAGHQGVQFRNRSYGEQPEYRTQPVKADLR